MKKTKNSKLLNNVKVSDADIKKYAKKITAVSKGKLIASIAAGVTLVGAGAGTATYFGLTRGQGGGQIVEQICTVTFNDNWSGGSTVTTVNVNKNSTVDQPKVAYHDGYGFAGWFTDESCTNEFNFDTKITSNINLYGKWVGEYDPDEGGLIFKEIEENGNIVGYAVSANNNVSLPHNLVIPRTYNNKPVIELAEYAFCYWDNYYYRYIGRDDIHTVTLPRTITEIPYYAFYGCEYLTRCDTSDDVITYVDSFAFDYCYSLEYFNFGKNIKSIGYYSFYGTAFKKIKFGSELIDLGNYAFDFCRSLEEVDFSECSKLTYMPYYGFCYCEGLKNILWPNNISELYEGAFYGCRSLSNITIPASIKKIGEECFAGCKNLSQIYFDDESELISIDAGAFKGCTSLSEITLPKYLVDIASNSFFQCSNLKKVYFTCESDQNFYVSRYDDNGALVFPEDEQEEYEKYSPTDPEYNASLLFNSSDNYGYSFIRNGFLDDDNNIECVTCKGGVMVNGRADLENTKVYIPLTITDKETGKKYEVKSINAGAFSYDSDAVAKTYKMITEVEIEVDDDNVNPNLLEICDNAFYGQTSISTIKNLDCCINLYRIGSFAFYQVGQNVESLTSISLDLSDSNVEDIGGCAFYGSPILNSITFPKSLLKVGLGAFNETKNLKIANFEECKNLVEFGYESSSSSAAKSGKLQVKTYGVFMNSAITAVDLSETQIDSIPEDAFYYCPLTDKVVLPNKNTLVYIGANAFYGSSLSAITIPSSVIEIDNYAFSGCNSLKTVYIDSITIAEQYNPGYLYETSCNGKTVYVPIDAECDETKLKESYQGPVEEEKYKYYTYSE